MDLKSAIETIESTSLPDAQKNALIMQLLGQTASVAAPPHADPLPAPLAPLPPIVPLVVAPVQPHIESITGPNGQRIDKVAVSGTPDTVTLPKTGHVLSLPVETDLNNVVWDKEGILGYAIRVALQAGSTIQNAINVNGALFIATPAPRDGNQAPIGWPARIDEFYNLAAYNPVDPNKAAADAAAWQAAYDRMKTQNPTSVPVAPAAPAPAAPAPGGPVVVEG